MYSYAIEVLEKEKQLLEKCLSEWDIKQYPEARKEREERLKKLNKAIEKLNDFEIMAKCKCFNSRISCFTGLCINCNLTK